MNKTRKTRKRKCSNYSVLNVKTNRCNKCPKKFIVRDGYTRKSRQTGRKTYVQEACIKSRGLPGKTSLRYGENNPGIGRIKKGELGKHGYHSVRTLSEEHRHRALRGAVKEYGAPRIVRKLGAIRTYLKNTSAKASSVFYKDQKWVRKTYSNSFKGDLKQSKLYNHTD